MRTVANRDSPVQMFVDRHRTSSKRVTKARLVYLPASIRYGYRIVFGNDSLRLDREHQIEILATTALKCCPLFLCHRCKLAIKLGDVAVAQESVRRFQTRDVCQPEFLRQATLPCAEVPLRTTSGLR